MYLLDTNLLAPATSYGPFLDEPLFTSSVSAQEVLGMQRPGLETGYRYALPVIDGRLPGIQQGVPVEYFNRIAIEHAVRRPVSKHTDRRVVPRSLLRAESLELGHEAITIAHDHANDRLFRAYASRGLRGTTLKRVLEKWEYLRSEIEVIIPLDKTIADRAVALANVFVESGYVAKGTARNTMNDMLIAATSEIYGIPLLTADTQLNEFYSRFGWLVRKEGSLYIASPTRPWVEEQADSATRLESRGFINLPRSLRSRSDQSHHRVRDGGTGARPVPPPSPTRRSPVLGQWSTGFAVDIITLARWSARWYPRAAWGSRVILSS